MSCLVVYNISFLKVVAKEHRRSAREGKLFSLFNPMSANHHFYQKCQSFVLGPSVYCNSILDTRVSGYLSSSFYHTWIMKQCGENCR